MIFQSPRAIGAVLSGLLGLGSAAISANATKACSAIALGTVKTLLSSFPDDLNVDYTAARTRYWSAANADVVPACVVFPTTAQEVSNVVTVLQNYTDVNFAMKSGGHNPNVGWSSVDGGVLISFSKLATTTYFSHSQTVDIGPGARWGEVMTALDPYDVAVVGGRIGDVGVGGLLLGCGLSFMSGEYGLPCDNIVNYEVVLSNATIVNANRTSNTDLFWALKGGGNQFGMVTKFTMTAIPIGKIWGGTRTFAYGYWQEVMNATHDFIENYDDPKASVIVTAEFVLDGVLKFFLVFFYYNGESPPAGVFNKFDAIPSLTDTTKAQSYPDLLVGNNEFNVYGLRYLIRGITLPNFPSQTGKDLLSHHFSTWATYITPTTLSSDVELAGSIFSIAFQPMPYAIPAASALVNPLGNILGLSPLYGDHVWMEYDISWLTSGGDNLAHSMAINITASIDAYTKSTYAGVLNSNYEAAEGDVTWEEYSPTFLNDAMYDQQPLQSYGDATYQKLKGIQQDYDPSGLFPTRTGGFKFI